MLDLDDRTKTQESNLQLVLPEVVVVSAAPGGLASNQRFVVTSAKSNPVAVDALAFAFADIGVIFRALVAEVLRGSSLSLYTAAIVGGLKTELVDFRGDITSSSYRNCSSNQSNGGESGANHEPIVVSTRFGCPPQLHTIRSTCTKKQGQIRDEPLKPIAVTN